MLDAKFRITNNGEMLKAYHYYYVLQRQDTALVLVGSFSSGFTPALEPEDLGNFEAPSSGGASSK